VLGAWAYWQQTVLRTIGVILAVLIPAGGYVQVFLFKMMSHMQSRLGPMEAGPHGSLQLVAEVGKFMQKEDVAPVRADKALFRIPPSLVAPPVVPVSAAVPFGPPALSPAPDIGIFFALGISSISVPGTLTAGGASANKSPLTGGLRAAGQLIAY